jgi:hypothetical protein
VSALAVGAALDQEEAFGCQELYLAADGFPGEAAALGDTGLARPAFTVHVRHVGESDKDEFLGAGEVLLEGPGE